MKPFGDLFSESLKEFGDKFVPILKIFLVFYVIPSILIGIVLAVFFFSAISKIGVSLQSQDIATIFSTIFSPSILGILIILAVILGLIYLVANVFMTVSYIYIGFSKKKDVPFGEVVSAAAGVFWKYLGFFILTGLALIGLFILLIVPGIIFMVYWIFASYILMSEKLGITDSWKRSKNIVKGRWWRTFGFLLLVGIIIWAFSLLVGFIPFLGGLISALVATPFLVIFLKNLYLDMKKK